MIIWGTDDFSSRWSLFPLTSLHFFFPQTNEASSESIASSPKRDTMSNFLPDSSCYELLTIIGNSGGLEDLCLLCEENNFCRFVVFFLIDCLFLMWDVCIFDVKIIWIKNEMPVLKVFTWEGHVVGQWCWGCSAVSRSSLKPVLDAPNHCFCFSPEFEGQDNSAC